MSNDSNEQGNDAAAFQVGDTVWTRLPGEEDISEGVVMGLADDRGGKRAYVCGPIGEDHDGFGFGMWIGFELLSLAPGGRATPAPAPTQTVPVHTAECEAEWTRQEAHNRQWPAHCPTCNGMGQTETPGSYDEPSWTDPCPDCTEQGRCPRCGKQNTLASEDSDGPCSACGWDYNGDDPFTDDRGAACICPEPPDPVYEPDSEPATPVPAATPPALDVAGISHSVTDALTAIQDCNSLSTDRTEDVVCRALNQIGVALIELLGAVETLAGNPKS